MPSKFLNISTDNTLGGNSPSDEIVSSQKAIKEYISNAGTGANTSLSNLTTTGQNIGNWSSNVTNCITEIPQDIKLELTSGVLTLKAGSKVYVPNGSGVFDELNITSDLVLTDTWQESTTTQFMFFVKSDGSKITLIRLPDRVSSGTTPPSAGTHFWYDTANNLVKKYSGSTDTGERYSLPFAVGTKTSTANDAVIARIDETFNGVGYIGVSWFMLPGLKALVPNGFNNDGSYKNIEFTNPSVYVYTTAATTERTCGVEINTSGNITAVENAKTSNVLIGLSKNRPTTVNDTYGYLYYATDENQWYYTSENTTANWTKHYTVLVGKRNGTSSAITYFNSTSALKTVDYNDTEFIANCAMPSSKNIDLTVGASGTKYTAPADGYFTVKATLSSSSGYVELSAGVQGFGSRGSASGCYCFIPCRKGRNCTLTYSNATIDSIIFVYATGAL